MKLRDGFPLFIFLLFSCFSRANSPSNRAPWPVTGPTADQTVTEADPSFFLEIRNGDGTQVTNPADFDPVGDAVSFDITLVRIDNPGLDPQVSVSFQGEFIVTNDGSLITPPATDITIFMY
ncbi:MAG: hypothetical protein P1P77_07580 [Spirochaetaceae bacterium]|nr:hypothetical protein [Spirochaetaceae bacterium]